MHSLGLALSPPPALGGESVNDTTGIAVVSLVSIVFGYLLIAGLWYFVFSARARERRKRARKPD